MGSGNGLVRCAVRVLTLAWLLPISAQAALIGFWTLDEVNASDGDTAADVNGSHDGVLETNDGATSKSAVGHYGGSFDFEGTDDLVEIAHHTDFNLTTGMTLAIWAQMEGNSSNNQFPRVLSKGQSTTSDGGYGLWVGDNRVSSLGARVLATTGTRYDASGGGGTENDNLWHHYAVTYDGTTLRHYVDGVQVGSNTASFTIRTSTADLHLGDGSDQRHFNGKIDEAYVFSHALSAAQVAALATTPDSWNLNGAGNWSAGGNWSGSSPNGSDAVASFGSVITGNTTVTLDSAATVGHLFFDDDNDYTISGANTLTLDVTTDAMASIRSTAANGNGAHSLDTNITLSDETLIANHSTGTFSLGGTVAAGAQDIRIMGSGLVQIDGTFTGTGEIDLMEGELVLGANDRLADTIDLKFSGGTFDTGGFNETLANLTLTENSVIDLGSGSSVLEFTGTVTGLATYELHIHNWSGIPVVGGGADQLIFSGYTMSTAERANIRFFSDAGVSEFIMPRWQLAGGEIVPAPEPSTWFAMVGLCGLIGWHIRKHRK